MTTPVTFHAGESDADFLCDLAADLESVRDRRRLETIISDGTTERLREIASALPAPVQPPADREPLAATEGASRTAARDGTGESPPSSPAPADEQEFSEKLDALVKAAEHMGRENADSFDVEDVAAARTEVMRLYRERQR